MKIGKIAENTHISQKKIMEIFIQLMDNNNRSIYRVVKNTIFIQEKINLKQGFIILIQINKSKVTVFQMKTNCMEKIFKFTK